MKKQVPAIVTCAHSRVGYTIARELGLAGVPVYVGDISSRAMAMRSRYVSGFFVYPSPFTEPEAFCECVLEKAVEYGAGVLIPVLEELYLVAKMRDLFDGRLATLMPSYETILSLHDKYRMGKLAEGLGVPTPLICTFAELEENEELVHDLSYPVMIKPRQGGGGWAVDCIENSDCLLEKLREGSHHGLPLERFFVQEKIIGEPIGVAMLFKKGVCMAKLGYRHVRTYPVNYGQCTFRASVHHLRAEKELNNLLSKLNWNGVCQADFLIDVGTNIPYLIDVNPRYWGSVGHSIASGINIPVMHYKLALGLKCSPLLNFDVQARSRWLGGDLMSFLGSMRNAPQKWQFMRDYIFSGSSYCDDFSLRDPLPFLGWGRQKMLCALGLGEDESNTVLDGIWK